MDSPQSPVHRAVASVVVVFWTAFVAAFWALALLAAEPRAPVLVAEHPPWAWQEVAAPVASAAVVARQSPWHEVDADCLPALLVVAQPLAVHDADAVRSPCFTDVPHPDTPDRPTQLSREVCPVFGFVASLAQEVNAPLDPHPAAAPLLVSGRFTFGSWPVA